MKMIIEVVSGIFVLVAIYLFLANFNATATIINSISSNSIQGIKALQGRA